VSRGREFGLVAQKSAFGHSIPGAIAEGRFGAIVNRGRSADQGRLRTFAGSQTDLAAAPESVRCWPGVILEQAASGNDATTAPKIGWFIAISVAAIEAPDNGRHHPKWRYSALSVARYQRSMFFT
jgi:hypothetical protein